MTKRPVIAVPDESGSARDKAYRTAFEAISAMAIGEDGFLREEDVVELAGVSRTPVREALQRLQAEGLVRLVPRKGAYVAAITPYEIQDLLDCRSLFECAAACSIVRNGLTGLVAALADLLDVHRRLWRADARQVELIECDQQWHATLVTGSRNALISEMYQSLRNRELRLMLTVVSEAGPARWKQAIEEHQVILAALRDDDAAGAEVAIRAHCDATGQAALSTRRPQIRR